MHVFGTLRELTHVELYMAWRQLDAFVFQKASKVMVHVWKDHMHRHRRTLAWRVLKFQVFATEIRSVDQPRTTIISTMLMIHGCLRALRILISRRAVTGIPSFSLCMRIRLRATTFPVVFWIALWTSLGNSQDGDGLSRGSPHPNVPSPSFVVMS